MEFNLEHLIILAYLEGRKVGLDMAIKMIQENEAIEENKPPNNVPEKIKNGRLLSV